jgi:class 3 adenylate cyclase
MQTPMSRVRQVERAWDWHFAASAEALWPFIADTARFNEAMGLGRYAVTDTPLPDGTVQRTGTARRLGRDITWREGVPQWIAGRHFAHRRDLVRFPVKAVATAIDLDPEPGGTRVRYRLTIETASAAMALLLRLFGLRSFERKLDRLFRNAGEAAMAGRTRGYEPAPPVLSAAARQRVARHIASLTELGYRDAEAIGAHILAAAESDLERMRPRTLARQWGLDPRGAIETFLAAARDGLLALRWDLLCPRCRGAKFVATGLDRLPQGAHCPSCNIEYERDFARNVEVTFEPDAEIRALGIGTYCIASPLASEHVKVQWTLAPGETVELAVALADGDYRARTLEPGGSADFAVAGGVVPQVALAADGPVLSAGAVGRLAARNDGTVPRTLVVEDRNWASDALTAHEVTTLQAFRDLFADAVLRPGDQVEIRRVALMFTDIRGSSDLYNRVGDARAYGWVREHYAVLTRAVRAHDGAVVKTIGDAVMAAFASPVDALAAALAIRDDIAAFNARLGAETGAPDAAIQVKLGLHSGPCIAVTLNDRLDYFGRTVNLAARLQNESRGDDIVLSEAMAEEPGVAALLAAYGPIAEFARVKGFSDPVAVRRVPGQGMAGEGGC